MAGIGIRLNRIYSKNTVTTNLVGFGYSIVVTIAPMILVIGTVILMQWLLGFNTLDYMSRELFSCTILYVFIFALLCGSPLNAVLSRYLSDVIYREKYEDIMPCYYAGLLINIMIAMAVAVPFCIREHLVGHVSINYVTMSLFAFLALSLVFYSMLYLSICKAFRQQSLFYLIGMLITVVLSLILTKVLKVEETYAMLASLTVGFLVIASLEFSLIRSYFPKSSGKFGAVFIYFGKNWQLIVTNFIYTLGLYMHNFVFWTTPDRTIVANTFVCFTSYDLATCIAMFTNISASVIFITGIEMNFHDKYKAYTEAVIGGRGMDIRNGKERMFRQLFDELMRLVRIQFIISTALFFILMFALPYFGMGGLVLQIYPSLAGGYFILFIMYATIIFLYYFNDLNGALLTAFTFAAVTAGMTFVSTHLPPMWYGLGLVLGAFSGWCVAYARIRVLEKKLDYHVFCEGSIMKRGHGRRPSNKVYAIETVSVRGR